jgi:hypothetical protein
MAINVTRSLHRYTQLAQRRGFALPNSWLSPAKSLCPDQMPFYGDDGATGTLR